MPQKVDKRRRRSLIPAQGNALGPKMSVDLLRTLKGFDYGANTFSVRETFETDL